VRHEEKSIFIPVTINGRAASYFFDTGGWVSSLSESEAERLGLRFTEGTGKIGSLTDSAAFRTAVADELAVGSVRLRNVSFAVFPDSREPWSLLPPGRRGLLGIPIIVPFRTLRWASDGSVQIGRPPAAFEVRKSNLMFDDGHLVVRAAIEGHTVSAIVDTGA